jgi:hypothetical protein
MTIFSSTASPGQRWKTFLPGAASIQSSALSMSTASALIRSRWLNTHARRPPPRTVSSQAEAHVGIDDGSYDRA